MEKLDKLVIFGKKPLFGDVYISGAKNAALPLMTISLLIDKGFELNNVALAYYKYGHHLHHSFLYMPSLF